MEAALFIGIPGAGKSSFFKARLFATHVRISLDLLKTRSRERNFLEICLATGQQFAVDNNNPKRIDRAPYIAAAKARRFTVVGYYFQSRVEDCLRRNAQRIGTECVPDVAILSAAAKLELPTRDEGFDRLWYVRCLANGFECEEWRDDV